MDIPVGGGSNLAVLEEVEEGSVGSMGSRNEYWRQLEEMRVRRDHWASESEDTDAEDARQRARFQMLHFTSSPKPAFHTPPKCTWGGVNPWGGDLLPCAPTSGKRPKRSKKTKKKMGVRSQSMLNLASCTAAELLPSCSPESGSEASSPRHPPQGRQKPWRKVRSEVNLTPWGVPDAGTTGQPSTWRVPSSPNPLLSSPGQRQVPSPGQTPVRSKQTCSSQRQTPNRAQVWRKVQSEAALAPLVVAQTPPIAMCAAEPGGVLVRGLPPCRVPRGMGTPRASGEGQLHGALLGAPPEERDCSMLCIQQEAASVLKEPTLVGLAGVERLQQLEALRDQLVQQAQAQGGRLDKGQALEHRHWQVQEGAGTGRGREKSSQNGGKGQGKAQSSHHDGLCRDGFSGDRDVSVHSSQPASLPASESKQAWREGEQAPGTPLLCPSAQAFIARILSLSEPEVISDSSKPLACPVCAGPGGDSRPLRVFSGYAGMVQHVCNASSQEPAMASEHGAFAEALEAALAHRNLGLVQQGAARRKPGGSGRCIPWSYCSAGCSMEMSTSRGMDRKDAEQKHVSSKLQDGVASASNLMHTPFSAQTLSKELGPSGQASPVPLLLGPALQSSRVENACRKGAAVTCAEFLRMLGDWDEEHLMAAARQEVQCPVCAAGPGAASVYPKYAAMMQHACMSTRPRQSRAKEHQEFVEAVERALQARGLAMAHHGIVRQEAPGRPTLPWKPSPPSPLLVQSVSSRGDGGRPGEMAFPLLVQSASLQPTRPLSALAASFQVLPSSARPLSPTSSATVGAFRSLISASSSVHSSAVKNGQKQSGLTCMGSNHSPVSGVVSPRTRVCSGSSELPAPAQRLIQLLSALSPSDIFKVAHQEWSCQLCEAADEPGARKPKVFRWLPALMHHAATVSKTDEKKLQEHQVFMREVENSLGRHGLGINQNGVFTREDDEHRKSQEAGEGLVARSSSMLAQEHSQSGPGPRVGVQEVPRVESASVHHTEVRGAGTVAQREPESLLPEGAVVFLKYLGSSSEAALTSAALQPVQCPVCLSLSSSPRVCSRFAALLQHSRMSGAHATEHKAFAKAVEGAMLKRGFTISHSGIYRKDPGGNMPELQSEASNSGVSVVECSGSSSSSSSSNPPTSLHSSPVTSDSSTPTSPSAAVSYSSPFAVLSSKARSAPSTASASFHLGPTQAESRQDVKCAVDGQGAYCTQMDSSMDDIRVVLKRADQLRKASTLDLHEHEMKESAEQQQVWKAMRDMRGVLAAKEVEVWGRRQESLTHILAQSAGSDGSNSAAGDFLGKSGRNTRTLEGQAKQDLLFIEARRLLSENHKHQMRALMERHLQELQGLQQEFCLQWDVLLSKLIA